MIRFWKEQKGLTRTEGQVEVEEVSGSGGAGSLRMEGLGFLGRDGVEV